MADDVVYLDFRQMPATVKIINYSFTSELKMKWQAKRNGKGMQYYTHCTLRGLPETSCFSVFLDF